MKQLKRVGAFIYVPLLFMCFGYLIIYIIGAPVINFASSAVELISLNDAPSFDQKGTNLYAQRTQKGNSSSAVKKTDDAASHSTNAESDSNTNSNDVAGSEVFNKEELASSNMVYPVGGDQFGEVVIDKVGINEPLYYGDSEDILRLGAGQYIGSMIPGDLGTTLIGGHNLPSFGKIYYLEPGDTVSIHTHYGDYTYQVTEVKVADYRDSSINTKLGDRSKRSLILYTCYPLDAIGLTPERVFVSADYVSGPIINEKS
ncbi:class D sortase [Enterococcus quebecensis]|uniref:Sortase n=1 Tax=Enterococcus quebecensis TaxID=903983 RepID=A0A1E5H3H3_9ENTE|nr:class D sortase [Enterococcus quebecensis]OEG19466.1 sortase [Enterococcus quebecensis]OJG75260.1 sortase [Enterococcus quebecensis]